VRSTSHIGFFDRAEALGVCVIENSYLKLLDAIHEHETKLMVLRHDLQRHIANAPTLSSAIGE
jgi:hypothetical protein